MRLAEPLQPAGVARERALRAQVPAWPSSVRRARIRTVGEVGRGRVSQREQAACGADRRAVRRLDARERARPPRSAPSSLSDAIVAKYAANGVVVAAEPHQRRAVCTDDATESAVVAALSSKSRIVRAGPTICVHDAARTEASQRRRPTTLRARIVGLTTQRRAYPARETG